jgi:AcrR family transcriptional regulator
MSDSRAVLLAAAAEQFAKYGPRGTRVQDIVKAAGVNERMIYHHFGSKDGLYTAVMLEQRAQFAEALTPALVKGADMDPYPGMRLVLGSFFDALRARPQVAALFVHEGLANNGPLALPGGVTGFLSFLAPIRSLYERGQAEGAFRAEVPFETAYATAFSALLALTVLAPRITALLPAGPETDPARFRDHAVALLLEGMTG